MTQFRYHQQTQHMWRVNHEPGVGGKPPRSCGAVDDDLNFHMIKQRTVQAPDWMGALRGCAALWIVTI